MEDAICLRCGAHDRTVPLVALRYHGSALWICPQCLPTLIHRPEELAKILGDRSPDSRGETGRQ